MLQDLDLGGNKSLWELTPALLSLKALTRLVINPFSYDQYLVEVLMVRGVEVDQEQVPYEDEMDFL